MIMDKVISKAFLVLIFKSSFLFNLRIIKKIIVLRILAEKLVKVI